MRRGGGRHARAAVERPFVGAAVAAVEETLVGLAAPADGGGVGGHGGAPDHGRGAEICRERRPPSSAQAPLPPSPPPPFVLIRAARFPLIAAGPPMPEAAAQPIRSNSFFSAGARRRRSRDRPRDRAGARPAARRDRADRLGEHRLQGGARGAGLGDDQQIRRRLSGPALLRRLPVRRHRRKAGDRARLQAVRLPLRQRPAQFRQPGQPGRVPGADAAGRHVHGARSRRRRPSHPRLAGQHVRALVQAASPTASTARRTASTWTRSSGSRASTSRS